MEKIKVVKLSVIVPVYNVEKYLERCLDSIINQTLKDIEIICINDGSTDNSLSILEEYKKKDYRIVIINQKNKGLAVARNVGIEIAQGEYLAFVDSDDWINPNFLECLYDSAKENNCDIAVGNIFRVPDRGKTTPFLQYKETKIYEDTNSKFEICDIPKMCYVWNRIYKREKLIKNKIKFIEGKVYEDVLFSHKALYYSGKLITVPDAIYYYFRHSNSIVAKTHRNKKFIKDAQYAEKLSEDFRREHNIDISKYAETVRKYKIFGLTILKIKARPNQKIYYFLNCKIFKTNKNGKIK